MDKLKTRAVLLAYNNVSCAEGLSLNKGNYLLEFRQELLTIIPRARMGSESIAHEAEGRMGY